MSEFFNAIFMPHNGNIRAVKAQVAQSVERRENASNRLEETIKGMLDENDRVTGRDRHVRQSGG